MKRAIIGVVIVMLIGLVLGSVGCGEKEKAEITPPPAPASELAQALTPASEAEGIKLIGVITETVTLTYFAKGARARCHGTRCRFTEQDGKTSVYTGIPLWLMCGWVDDDVKHGGGGFNDELAQKGYRIIVTTADGQTAIFDSRKISQNDNIILANKVGSKFIEGYPTLVSSEIGQTLKLENIVEIRLEFE